MNIGLLAVDSNYPNLALMKISAWHKNQGDRVEWYNPFEHYDKLYMAKVFSFTEDYHQYMNNADCIEKGGTGYDIQKLLPEQIDRMQPDYSLYPSIDHKTAYGFLTRGCPNKCKWCVVPKKEGNIRPYFALRHEIKEEQPNEEICPIATHPYEIIGTQLYESIDELVERWNNLKIQRIPSFDEILEVNRDVLERIKEKGD